MPPSREERNGTERRNDMLPNVSNLQTSKSLLEILNRDIDRVTNGDRDENSNAYSEAERSIREQEESANNEKQNPTRVSIGEYQYTHDDTMAKENYQHKRMLDDTDEPIRKKQKTSFEMRENGPVAGHRCDENSHENDCKTAPMFDPSFSNDGEANRYEDTIQKLKLWINELLAVKQIVDDLRLENAIILNNLYKVGIHCSINVSSSQFETDCEEQ